MSERDALLKAITAEPDDDAVRLVFADWLDDHGEADRAAFIRAQCAAAGLPTWDCERRLLLWQAAGLLERHPEWRAGLPALDGLTWGRFERGFIAEVVVTDFAALVRHADAVGQVGTVSAAVVLSPERSASLAGLPREPWLRRLVLDSIGPGQERREMIHWDGVAALAQAELLGTVRELHIDNHWPSENGLNALARSPHLRGLTVLSLNDAHAMLRGQLLGSPNTRRLRRLSLRGPHNGLSVHPGFRVEVAERLAESANLSGLESLDISNNSADPDSYRVLFASPHLAGLRELTARRQLLGPEKLMPFSAPRAAPRLKALDIGRNHLRQDGLRHLLAAPVLDGLERLCLANCSLTGPDCELLAGAAWRTTLTSLDLSHNRLHGAGLRRLFAADWPRLRVLRLGETSLKGPALPALCGWNGLKRLSALDLTGHQLGQETEKRLRDAGLPAEARLALGAGPADMHHIIERDDW